MDREQEIAALVMQQAREDHPFQPREPFVAFSIDHTPPGLDVSWSDFLDQDGNFSINLGWGPWSDCTLHGRKHMKYDAAGIPRCSACTRERMTLKRRSKGIPPRPVGPGCGHDPKNFRPVGKDQVLRCFICTRRRDREYYKRKKLREGGGYGGATHSPEKLHPDLVLVRSL
jgi:hypothetical protein